MVESRDIQYRRMVSNIARELNVADVEQIAYVRLTGREDTTKYSAANPTASALDLVKNLERRGDYSVNKTNGLKEVVMDASRKDLVDKINDFEVQESKCSMKARPRNERRQKKSFTYGRACRQVPRPRATGVSRRREKSGADFAVQ